MSAGGVRSAKVLTQSLQANRPCRGQTLGLSSGQTLLVSFVERTPRLQGYTCTTPLWCCQEWFALVSGRGEELPLENSVTPSENQQDGPLLV